MFEKWRQVLHNRTSCDKCAISRKMRSMRILCILQTGGRPQAVLVQAYQQDDLQSVRRIFAGVVSDKI